MLPEYHQWDLPAEVFQLILRFRTSLIKMPIMKAVHVPPQERCCHLCDDMQHVAEYCPCLDLAMSRKACYMHLHFDLDIRSLLDQLYLDVANMIHDV